MQIRAEPSSRARAEHVNLSSLILVCNYFSFSTTKPEVVVTSDKMTALLPLLPAPTPTRFLGKMQLLKEENYKKKILELSQNVSRRSSLAPVDDVQENVTTVENEAPKEGFKKKYNIIFFYIHIVTQVLTNLHPCPCYPALNTLKHFLLYAN